VGEFHIKNLVSLHRHLLQKEIRKHANTMMRRTQNDKPEPAHEEAINKYKSCYGSTRAIFADFVSRLLLRRATCLLTFLCVSDQLDHGAMMYKSTILGLV
jgi:hypothetical protein